ncbi:MAG TPA: TerC family protein [Phycisphaerales bacterium]|nr:TerC family protein [Phycisphaerales bacterium]
MTVWLWIGFLAFILVMLMLDLLVVNRKAHTVKATESLVWTGVCVVLALSFSVAVYFMYEHNLFGVAEQRGAGGELLSGKAAAMQYVTGWMVEYALSLDNIMIFAIVFSYFQVRPEYQHRVLFWGVFGALVMRGIMIAAGAALLTKFHWMIYVFGVILLITAAKLLVTREESTDLSRNLIVRLTRRFLPVSHSFDGERFFTVENGRRLATPMFVVLLVVEFTDVIFAVDSIPAIFAITRDPFLVFTSNVFAIMGLRSLYFALSSVLHHFRYVKTSLVFVLAFIGVKMIIEPWYQINTGASLAVVGGLLATGLLASLMVPAPPEASPHETAPLDDLADFAEKAWKRMRRVVILVIGVTLLLIAIPIAIIPGPGGIPVAILGLAVLATEFIWARKILKKMKTKAEDLRDAAKRMVGMKQTKPAEPPATPTPEPPSREDEPR